MNVPVITILAATESETGLAVFGLSFKAILLQTGTFLVLFLIVKKYALQTIVDNLENRRATIDEGLVNAEEANKRLSEAVSLGEQEIAKANKKSQSIIEQANVESGEVMQKARDDARVEHDKLIDQAQAKIDQQRQKVAKDLQTETAALVAEATETIIGEKLDAKKDAALLDKALQKELA